MNRDDPKIVKAMQWYETECLMAMLRPSIFVHPITGAVDVRPDPDRERIRMLKETLRNYGLLEPEAV